MSIISLNDPHQQPATDILLEDISARGTFYCRNRLTAGWGYAFPAAECATLHIMMAGRCVFSLDDGRNMAFEEGDILLFPHGSAHIFREQPDAAVLPYPAEGMEDMEDAGTDESGRPSAGAMICGGAHLAGALICQALPALPDVIQLSARQRDNIAIRHLVELLDLEIRQWNNRHTPVSHRLFELIITFTLRTWFRQCAQPTGWLYAARDPKISRVLAAIHRRPEHHWTLESLAAEAGMSRSALAGRFNTLLGRSPVNYLTAWRMQLADDWLRTKTYSIAAVADKLGYESEPAFSRAFKRHRGFSPGASRRQAT